MFSLSKIASYQGKWELINSEKMSQEDIDAVKTNKVIEGDYGKSVCLFLKNGRYQYIPVSTNGRQPSANEVLDLQKVTIETLHRDGSEDIYRARID